MKCPKCSSKMQEAKSFFETYMRCYSCEPVCGSPVEKTPVISENFAGVVPFIPGDFLQFNNGAGAKRPALCLVGEYITLSNTKYPLDEPDNYEPLTMWLDWEDLTRLIELTTKQGYWNGDLTLELEETNDTGQIQTGIRLYSEVLYATQHLSPTELNIVMNKCKFKITKKH